MPWRVYLKKMKKVFIGKLYIEYDLSFFGIIVTKCAVRSVRIAVLE